MYLPQIIFTYIYQPSWFGENLKIAMENGPWTDDLRIKMLTFHCCWLFTRGYLPWYSNKILFKKTIKILYWILLNLIKSSQNPMMFISAISAPVHLRRRRRPRPRPAGRRSAARPPQNCPGERRIEGWPPDSCRSHWVFGWRTGLMGFWDSQH